MSRTSTMQPSTMGYVFKQDMPHHLSILFRARPPLEYAEPLEKGKCKPITSYFDGHRDYFALFENEEPPKKPEIERPMEKRKRMKEMKMMENLKKQEEDKKAWNPYKDSNIKSKEAYNTLFVYNLSYKTDERSLKREFERFGRIQSVRVVVDQKTGKSKGYAFIEFEKESQMERAYSEAQQRRIDGRKVNVDYERGRTKKTWLPMRLGGGYRSREGRIVNKRMSLEEEQYLKELKEKIESQRKKSRSRSQDKIRPSLSHQVKEEEKEVTLKEPEELPQEELKQEKKPEEEENGDKNPEKEKKDDKKKKREKEKKDKKDKKKKEKKDKKHKKDRHSREKDEKPKKKETKHPADYEEESGEINELD